MLMIEILHHSIYIYECSVLPEFFVFLVYEAYVRSCRILPSAVPPTTISMVFVGFSREGLHKRRMVLVVEGKGPYSVL